MNNKRHRKLKREIGTLLIAEKCTYVVIQLVERQLKRLGDPNSS